MLDGVRWILFDAVGTLMYPDPPVAEVYWRAAGRFGSGLSIAEIEERFPLALERNFAGGCATSEANERQRWRKIVGDVISDIPQHIDTVFEYLWQHFSQPRHWGLYEDVESTLGQLHCRGFQLGIASNFDARLKCIVAGHSMLAGCDVAFVSSDIGYSKPDARFFRGIQERLGVDNGQIALVGDDDVCDVQAAIAAGWRSIHLDRRGNYLERSDKREGSIRTLAELL
ncbi:MAG: HAD-IA family hydrolase [Planctomycetia bacterium]|nr:HAD-IA family hydrolase [Planctomycetia bacterium]